MEILVIGGGAAGMSAASWARRKAPEARITVLERTNIISHAPCGVPYYIGGLFKDYWLLQAYDVKFFRERRNIEVLTNAEAEELDVRSRVVVARVGGQRVKLEFDRLIVATGARPRRLLSADARVLYVHHPADLTQEEGYSPKGGLGNPVPSAPRLRRVSFPHRPAFILCQGKNLDPT